MNSRTDYRKYSYFPNMITGWNNFLGKCCLLVLQPWNPSTSPCCPKWTLPYSLHPLPPHFPSPDEVVHSVAEEEKEHRCSLPLPHPLWSLVSVLVVVLSGVVCMGWELGTFGVNATLRVIVLGINALSIFHTYEHRVVETELGTWTWGKRNQHFFYAFASSFLLRHVTFLLCPSVVQVQIDSCIQN